jgi:hypothetical protein
MKRREEYSAPPEQVDFLEQLNDVVARGEDNLDFRPEHPHHPVILIVGAPRSGTTVLMQWLQHVGFAVPSNIAARFPRNPFFAGMLQRLLSDPTLNFHDELTIPGTQHAFHSDYGKTQSPLAPHEFSFFFRRFFPVTVGEKLDERALRNCDVDGFLRGVSMFGAALDKPVVLKGLIIQYNLHIFRNSPNVIIVHVLRNEADNVCSLLRQREIVAGDINEWISVRPPQYSWLKDLSPVEQVAGQVHYTNVELQKQLKLFPACRVISLTHENFCACPKALYRELVARVRKFAPLALPAEPDRSTFKVKRYDETRPEHLQAMKALSSVRSLALNRPGGRAD